MNPNNFLVMYPNVITVQGYNRSIISDLYRRRFRYIPNALAEILNGLSDTPQTQNDLLAKVNSDSQDELSNQIDLLITEDYLLKSDKELFERLKVPVQIKTEDSLIKDCIIEHSVHSNYSLSTFLKTLDIIGVKNLEIRFLDVQSFIIRHLELKESLQDSTIEYLQILAPFDLSILEILKNEYKDFERLNLFTFFDSSKRVSIDKTVFEINFTSQKTIDNSQCGCISPSYFTFDLQNHNSNKIQNSCLSKKLSIDHQGKIKNCPSKSNDYGILDQNTLENIVQSFEFQKDWGITKDKVLVCSDCEFRWNCSDCRVFVQDKANPFSKPSKCRYNPYISKWEWEEGYLPEDETGISIIDEKLIIDEEKLNHINTLLWA